MDESIVTTLLNAINEVLHESGREGVSSLSPETRLRQDLGFDSLELAVLTVKLEAATGVDVFARGVVNTVEQVEERLRGQ